MTIYLIERHVPGASSLSQNELQDISVKSNSVVAGLGVPYRWIRSYVAGDKIYCVHETDDPANIHRHANVCGIPVNVVTEVPAIIGPETGR